MTFSLLPAPVHTLLFRPAGHYNKARPALLAETKNGRAGKLISPCMPATVSHSDGTDTLCNKTLP